MTRIRDWFRQRDIDWGITGFLLGYHLILLVALPLYLIFFTPSLALIVATLVLLSATLMSITMGYHRLYSHRTYDAHPIVEWVLLFFGTAAIQGSIIKWSFDHRLHHKHVDGDEDPYGIQHGFWYAHMLWLFEKQKPVKESIVKDLFAKPLLRSQHEHYGIWAIVVNVVITFGIGIAVGDILGAVVIAFLLRLFLGHHSTWFINSAAHMWGTKPYSTEHSAVNNFFISLITYGEGYHNYHHTFAGDYRNGVRWWQFDPSKLAIWLLSKVGLTSNLKRVNELTIKKRLVLADRNLMLEHLTETAQANLEALRARGHESLEHLMQNIESARLVGNENLERLQALREENIERMRAQIDEATATFNERVKEVKLAANAYRAAKAQASREEIARLRESFKAKRDELKADWNEWQVLTREVLSLEPAFA
ncbi:MAG: fatty acid desaturase [Rhodothermales bacterium]|nr:fatty acid desaturase [Rhodothermales bacterium]MBO6780188.1 fatty acid desaturase [Rhodothermales bacterium]